MTVEIENYLQDWHSPRWVEADCRTCTRHYTDKGQQVGCSSIVACVNGDRYEPLPPVRLWRTTP